MTLYLTMHNMSVETFFDILPHEIIVYVLRFCHAKDVMMLAVTCKIAYCFALSDCIWNDLIRYDFSVNDRGKPRLSQPKTPSFDEHASCDQCVILVNRYEHLAYIRKLEEKVNHTRTETLSARAEMKMAYDNYQRS
jgi:hypothetical protein